MTFPRSTPLKRLAAINPETLPEDTEPTKTISYIDIGAVGEGMLLEPPTALSFGEAPSRARRVVRSGDILISTVRTYLRAVLPAVDTLDGAIASTGFAVIRPPADNARYLAWAVQSQPFVDDVVSRSVGVSYPAIAPTAIASIPVWSPSSSIQALAADFLDRETARIDELVAKKRRMIGLLSEERTALVANAVTGGMYPDTAMVESGEKWIGLIPATWHVVRTKAVLREKRRYSSSGKGALLTVSHIRGVGLREESPDVTMFLAESLEGYKEVQPNDLVVNTMWAWMGGAGVSPIQGLVSPAYHVYEPTATLYPPFLDLLIRSAPMVAEMRRHSQGVWSSRLRLYPDHLGELRIPLPPLEEQKKISQAVDARLATAEAVASRTRRQLDLLAEYRQAVITAAVTGRLDEATLRGERPVEEAMGVEVG